MSDPDQPVSAPGAAAASDPPHYGVWSPGRRLLTVGLVLIVTLVASEALAVATVMPQVEAELGQIRLYGWVFSAFFLGNLLGIVIAGRASDRMRPVIPFIAGVVLFLVGLTLAGLAGSMTVLVAARLLQGIGAGALPTVAYVAIGREYHPDARPRMFALMSTAWVVPSLIGPAAAAVVGEHFGWKWVFLGLVPLVTVCGLAVVGSMGRIPAPSTPSEGSSLRDAVLVTAGAGLALFGLDQSNPFVAVPLIVIGLAVLLTAFRRLTPPGTLRARPGLPAAVMIRGVLTFAFFQADAYVPLGLTSVKGVSTAYASIAVTSCSIFWTAGSWIQERQVARVGVRSLVRSGFLFTGFGIALMMVSMLEGVSPAVGIVAWSIGGLGIGLAYAPLSITALAVAAPGEEGAATSALQLSDVLGVALGTGIGGVIVAGGSKAGWSPRPGILLVYLMSLAVAVIGVALSRRLPSVLARSGASDESGREPVVPSHSTALDNESEIDRIVAGASPQGVFVPESKPSPLGQA